ncbi:chitin deacetylase [Phlyctema vagabunda]|uniref:Chitin deacetylase n=1 Tax=Phlyctema vagabunda TaxID=108571 RepID=A0ABR4PA01_9HELO
MYLQQIFVSLAGLLAVGCLAEPIPATGAAAARDIAPDHTCGLQASGENHGYNCPSTAPCCGPYGFCGSSKDHCLTSVGCQSAYSNTTDACYDPIDGQTTTPDNTCGKTGAGSFGYRCDISNLRCCSAYGYCGNTEAYCQKVNGCQYGYGFCVPNDA